MEAFTTLAARAISMPENDVDTDIIFPARFLLITEKKGLGRYAFYERRFDAAGAERADFVLNQAANANAKILVAGENFGCGSSREQAPWALGDLGIRCIVAPSFGEIFYGNCFKNGMLPIMLDSEALTVVRGDAEAGATLTVDLDARLIRRADGEDIPFAIEDWRRTALLNGWDEIETILARRAADIATFEAQQCRAQPWLWRETDMQEHEHHG